jgi:hypothetical protein
MDQEPSPPITAAEIRLRTRYSRDIEYQHNNIEFILPLWIAAGFADWTRHRATRIEKTAGAKESLMHLLMLVEAGIPLLAGLFLEITAPVLALMIGAFFVHEATALWDVTYAVKRREVTPVEQHIHSFLEMLPLMAIGFVSVLHWPDIRALAGRSRAPRPWLRWKKERLPAAYVGGLLASVALIEFLPYLEELRRDWREYPGRLVPPP